MGVIDKLWVKLTCKGCKVTETSSARDTGYSVYSNWESLDPFTHFNVTCRGGGKETQTVISAKCKTRGSDATVQKSYGMDHPKGF